MRIEPTMYHVITLSAAQKIEEIIFQYFKTITQFSKDSAGAGGGHEEDMTIR